MSPVTALLPQNQEAVHRQGEICEHRQEKPFQQLECDLELLRDKQQPSKHRPKDSAIQFGGLQRLYFHSSVVMGSG